MKRTINKSLATTLQMQQWPKDREVDKGGWRYVMDIDDKDSDLSLTGWNLMFLRSARNAGFDVPKKPIDDAVAYVRRTFDKEDGVFIYTTAKGDSHSRAMAGAGILALAHAGFHNSDEAQTSARWLQKYSLAEYNTNGGLRLDRYHYSLFNSCYAMYQLGGDDWKQFFPPTVRALLAVQAAGGSWTQRATSAIGPSAMPTPRRSWFCHSAHRTSFCRFFSDDRHGIEHDSISSGRSICRCLSCALCVQRLCTGEAAFGCRARGRCRTRDPDNPQSNVLNPDEWRRVDAAVERALGVARRSAAARRVLSHDQQRPAGRHEPVRAGLHGARAQSGRRPSMASGWSARRTLSCRVRKRTGWSRCNGPPRNRDLARRRRGWALRPPTTMPLGRSR